MSDENLTLRQRMNQRQRADAIVVKIGRMLDESGVMQELEALLGESQNDPPLGTRDGSIDAERWKMYFLLYQSMEGLPR